MAAPALSTLSTPSQAATIARAFSASGASGRPALEQLELERAAQRQRIVLQVLRVFDGPFSRRQDRVDDRLDARDALEGQAVGRLEHDRRPVAGRVDVVVGGRDVALRRVDDPRQFFSEAVPFVLARARAPEAGRPSRGDSASARNPGTRSCRRRRRRSGSRSAPSSTSPRRETCGSPWPATGGGRPCRRPCPARSSPTSARSARCAARSSKNTGP